MDRLRFYLLFALMIVLAALMTVAVNPTDPNFAVPPDGLPVPTGGQ